MWKCLCLHGFGENKDVYSPFVFEMSKIMPTVSVDLVGHGDLRKDEYRISDVTDHVDQAIASLECENIILVGTSFGGIISYIMSSDNQTKYVESRNKIRGLIINDVPFCIPHDSFKILCDNLCYLNKNTYESLEELNADYIKVGFKADREPISDENWNKFLQSSIKYGKTNYDLKFFETILRKDNGIDSIAEHAQFNTMSDGSVALDLRYYCEAIDRPILLFIGERTTFFPEYVRQVIQKQKNVQAVEIPGAGHFIDLSMDSVMYEIDQWFQMNFMPLPNRHVRN